MAVVKIDKNLNKVYSRHPFLKNFPFSDFAVEAEELKLPSVEIEDYTGGSEKPVVVNFAYTRGKQRTLISVFDRELEWLNSRADSILELDAIVEKVNS